MALQAVQTPRDRLERLIDYAVRARRYWWLVACFVVIGGVLSVAFAMTRPHRYQSSSVLFYHERIQTSLLQGRDAATMQRNIGERYRELLLARGQLAKIVLDPELNPLPDVLEAEGMEAAVEELRLMISFQVRGANTFRIVYTDTDRDRAAKVTKKLTDLLIEKETELRIEQATATVAFAEQQLQTATASLIERERARAAFLVQHPEFAQDVMEGGQSEGAAVRRRGGDRAVDAAEARGNPRLSALERQRARIRARLDAADNPGTPVRIDRAPSAAELEARRLLDRANDEVRQANRQIDDLRARGLTDNHPDMRKARETLAGAQSRARRAETELAAAQAANPTVVTPPRSEADRAALERELRTVEQQIAAERMRSGTRLPDTAKPNDVVDAIVALETEWARLRREVAEQGERVQTLSDSVFRAQLDAQTKIAEQGNALQVVDEAYRPMKPIGKGKKLLVMAGLVVFTGLGLALAVGLAIVDDRIYRRVDLEQLDGPPVLGVVPPARARRWWQVWRRS